MNGSVDPVLSHRSTSPRPPVEGKEVVYKEEQCSKWDSRECQLIFGNSKEFQSKMSSSFCNTPENAPVLPVGVGSEKNAFDDHDGLESVSSSPPAEPGTPPYFKWAQNLHYLLNDIEGVRLFMQYLKQENHGTVALDFWFACEGVKKDYSPESKEHIRKIRAIYRHYIRRLEEINCETKNEIKNKIESQIGMDQAIFDKAQREVENVIMRTTYPNFLRSDLYLQHIQGIQNCVLQESPKSEGTPVSVDNGEPLPREGPAVLPTVHEDSELQITTCGRIPLTREALLQRNRFYSGDLTLRTRPEAEAGHYLKPPNKSYTSCHVKYSSYLPTSEQNSELHSMSSDAQTDDAVSLTDSSVDHGPCLNSKNYPKKPKSSKYDWPVNKDSFSHNTFIPRTQRMPPVSELNKHPEQFAAVLTEKLNEYLRELESGKKMTERIQKLEDWKTSKPYDDLQSSSLRCFSQQPCEGNSLQIWNLSSKLERLSCTEDSDQAILDQHVSRVWQDSAHQTPSRSPGCISPPAQSHTPVLDCRRVNPCNAVSNTQSICPTFGTQHSYHKPNKNPQYMSFYSSSSRHRKDRDICSSDSGTVHDFTPEEPVPPPLHNHKNMHYSQGNYSSGIDQYPPAPADHFQNRRCRESQRRSNSKKITMTDSSSSCVDSGVSVVCDPVPSHLAREKVANWLDSKSDKDSFIHHKKSSHSATSPVLSRSSKKPVMYNSSRPGTLEGGNSPWPQLPSNTTSSAPQSSRYDRSHHTVQLSQASYPPDPSMPPLPQPDTTTQLVEARRRLEDERAKQIKLKPGTSSRDKVLCDINKMRSLYKMTNDLQEDSTLHRKSSRKSCPGSVQSCSSASSGDVTVIGYCFGSKTVPYLTKLPGKNITLRQFKTLISKKGNFKYFFKKASDDFGTGVVFEEISDDCEVLPLWEGKIFSVIEQVEC